MRKSPAEPCSSYQTGGLGVVGDVPCDVARDRNRYPHRIWPRQSIRAIGVESEFIGRKIVGVSGSVAGKSSAAESWRDRRIDVGIDFPGFEKRHIPGPRSREIRQVYRSRRAVGFQVGDVVVPGI